GAGAGAGKGSPGPLLTGRVAYGVGGVAPGDSVLGAKSSKVSQVAFEIPLQPPTSDIRTRLCPLGATSRTSRSFRQVWWMSFSETRTLETTPITPETWMMAG